MDTPRFVIGPFSVLCILGLVMGTASALVITATDTGSMAGDRQCQRPSPEDVISHLKEKGADVTEVKTALQRRDTEAVKAWLGNYFQSHRPELDPDAAHPRPDLTDTTQQQQIVPRLEEKGVDITEAEAEFESGDTSAVKVWLDNYLHAHEGEMPFYHPCGELPREIPSGTSSQSNQ